MARSLFGGRVGDTVASLYNLGNRQVYTLPVDANGDPATVTLTIWDEPDGTQLTDLRAADGTTVITQVIVPVGGQVPEFFGPDGVNVSVYVKDPDGDYYRLDARADDAAAAAEAAQTAAEAAQAAAEAVGATNDTIIAGRINDPASATASALMASFARVLTPEAFGAIGDLAADDTAALQAMLDAVNPGDTVLIRRRHRVTATLKLPAASTGILITGGGARSYNEADSGLRSGALVGDAGVTILQIGDDAPTTVAYRGPRIEGLTFREAGDAQTATLLDIRAVCNWTVRDCNFRGAQTAYRVDSYGYDASWGLMDHPIIYNCVIGGHYLGASSVVMGGNYSVEGPSAWGLYIEPKGSVQSAIRMFGTKIDVRGSGAVYSEGGALTASGVGIELTGSIDNQVGYRFVRDAAKNVNSGKNNKILGGSVTGTTGTGHTGVDVGTDCDRTAVLGLGLVNITTPLVDSGVRTTCFFSGDAFITDRVIGAPHYEIRDGAGAALMQVLAGASTAVHLLMSKAGAKLRVRLGGTTSTDEFIVQDSTGANLFRFQGNGGSTIGPTGTTNTQTVNGKLAHVGSGVGFNGTTPIAKRAATANATDLASVIALANALNADLQAYGLKS